MIQGLPKEVVFYGEYEEQNTEKRENIIRDEIDGLSKESVVGVAKLFQEFRAGSTKNIKPLIHRMNGLSELSSLGTGKVRIILYHVEGNIYVVTHVYYNNSDSAIRSDHDLAEARAKEVLLKKDAVIEYVEDMRAEEKRAAGGGMSR